MRGRSVGVIRSGWGEEGHGSSKQGQLRPGLLSQDLEGEGPFSWHSWGRLGVSLTEVCGFHYTEVLLWSMVWLKNLRMSLMGEGGGVKVIV